MGHLLANEMPTWPEKNWSHISFYFFYSIKMYEVLIGSYMQRVWKENQISPKPPYGSNRVHGMDFMFLHVIFLSCFRAL